MDKKQAQQIALALTAKEVDLQLSDFPDDEAAGFKNTDMVSEALEDLREELKERAGITKLPNDVRHAWAMVMGEDLLSLTQRISQDEELKRMQATIRESLKDIGKKAS